jgi:hypothetical protein
MDTKADPVSLTDLPQPHCYVRDFGGTQRQVLSAPTEAHWRAMYESGARPFTEHAVFTADQMREYGALCARQERERAALCCEDLATLMEWGAGDPEPGGRLRQAARNIRSGKEPVQYAQYGPGAALEDSHE